MTEALLSQGARVDVQFLRSLPQFAKLNEAEVHALAEQAELWRFDSGAELIRQGEPADAMYIIQAGRAEVVVRARDGSEKVIDQIGPGEPAGELALLSGTQRTATVRSLEPVVAVALRRDALEAAMEHREFARQMALDVAKRLSVRTRAEGLKSLAERRARELAALFRVEQVLHRSLRREDVLQGLVDVAADILEADKTSVLVWDEQHKRLVVGATRGFSPESLAAMSHGPGDGVTYLVATSGEPIAVEDAQRDPRVAHRITDPEGIRSLIHVPIRTGGEVFGVFGVNYCQPRSFSGDEQRVLLVLAQRAAMALENARLFEVERQTREGLEVALEAGQMGAWEWDARTGRVSWSQQLELIHGRTPGTFEGTFESYFADVHPEDRDYVRTTIAASLEGGTHHLEYRIVWPDGSVHWVEARGRALTNAHGQRIGLRGVCVDVTARKQVEAERARLLASERAARLAAESAVARTASLQRVTAALSRAVSPADVVQVVLTAAVANLGATNGAIALRVEDDRYLEVLGTIGSSPNVTGTRISTNQSLASVEALHTQESILLDATTAGGGATAHLPIRLDGHSLGVMTLGFEGERSFGEADLAFVTALAQHCGQALDRARLYERAGTLAALEERQRLARELHDSVSQALFGIALAAQTAQSILDEAAGGDGPGGVAELAEPLRYVLTLAEGGLAEMRALIFELRPESLERQGLVAALEKQAASLRARYRLLVNVLVDHEPDVPLASKEALLRIAQEALHNVVKHAHANTVDIRLTNAPKLVLLEIADDGLGFDPHGAFPGHLGLRSMQERAESIGATIAIESTHGRGARLRVELATRSTY